MANINLISARRAQRVRLAKIAKGLGIALVGATTVGLGSVAFMFGQILMAGSHLTRAEADLQRLRPILEETEAAEAQRLALQPKLETLTEAQKQTRRWWDVMEGFKHAVPSETWLTNIAVEKAGDDADLLRISGVTANQSRVGETMFRLSQQSAFYNKVDLQFTQVNKTEDVPRVEFELAAHMQPLTPPAPASGDAAEGGAKEGAQ